MSRKDSSLEYRRVLKLRILETASTMFRQNGFKAVKMDDIAHALVISKRTLYEIYPNKEDLIFEAVKKSIQLQHQALIERISATSDTMDILIEFFKMRIEECKNTNDTLLDDMQQYPKINKFLEENKDKHSEQALSFFRKGQEEGYFLSDINMEMIHELNGVISDYFITSRMYMKYDGKDVLRTLMFLFVRSICTDRGIKRIDSLMELL